MRYSEVIWYVYVGIWVNEGSKSLEFYFELLVMLFLLFRIGRESYEVFFIYNINIDVIVIFIIK